MKVLVTGAGGQLGHDVSLELARRGIDFVAADRAMLDITDKVSVEGCFSSFKPDAVIHCAAYTCVDKAETEREKCSGINIGGTENIALACEAIGAKLVYISSDYVYGDSSDELLVPDSPKHPINFYGETKLAGENKAVSVCSRLFIVRTSWVFGLNGCNFVKTMLRISEERDEISVVCDQFGSPTYTKDLAVLLCDMVTTDKYGIYNASNEGYCSWADFARAIFCVSGRKATVVPIDTEHYHSIAARQINSRLSKECLDNAGFSRLPAWQDALKKFVSEELKIIPKEVV